MAIKIAGVDVINDDRELVLAKLTDISETISSTAVDVFVYDTSKDSDGGAWRHRTQHTSWYNEGASSTRGSRKEFPAVAVIVAETSKVTIYDGDDPSLPMWMVFNAGGGYPSTYALGETAWGGPNAVLMLNGTLCTPRGLGGLPYMSFIDDACYRISTDGFHSLAGGVAVRNSGMTDTISNSSKTIVNGTVNDVAMTVLPDAPTDPATGLPVPTIAVATGGGVSVITDSGAVYDSSYTGVWRSVSISDDTMYAASPTTGSMYIFYDIGSISADGFSGVAYNRSTIPAMSEYYFGGTEGRNAGNAFKGDTAGITLLADDPTTPANGMVAYTTSTYNTGWMNGNIKLAALADTTAETFGDAASGATVSDPNLDGVYDGEHVTNSDFATGDLTGWSQNGSGDHTISLSSGGGAMDVTRGTSGSGNGEPYQALATEAGKFYQLIFDVSGTPMSTIVENALGGTQLVFQNAAVGPAEITFTATEATTYIRFIPDQTTSTSTISNVSVRLADPDRSVKGKGLAVHGSITKAPVATGADVVAYSGFSSSNYLEQPYNPDLNFGTGDFCVMGWLKTNATGNDYIIDCRNAASNVGFLVLVDVNGGLYFAAQNAASGNVTGTVDVTSDTWRHFVCVRSNSGTNYSIYVDGQLDTTSVDTAEDVDSTDRILVVGAKVSKVLRFVGSLALLRISATAPTADQIRKIYEDERPLFQENAKATLTGSSDAVTALAHDPDTELLHVGTSGGRSVFQGLRRVEEHTGTDSQSLAAISAVDGLVVEGK